MKSNRQINSITKLKEPEVKYKSSGCDVNILLWVVNMDGTILVKKPTKSQGSSNEVCDLTVNGETLKHALLNLEYSTGILCEQSNTSEVYSSNTNDGSNNYKVFFLTLDLDEIHKDIIEDKFKGKFIDYREILTNLNKESLTTECKEALLNLISVLYEKYSFL